MNDGVEPSLPTSLDAVGPQPPGWGPFFGAARQLLNLGRGRCVVPYVAYAASPTGSNHRVTRLALRSHYWGVLVVVVAAGELNAEGAARLASYLRRVQLENDLVVDLWDITRCDPDGIATLEAAKERAEAAGWGFAVVADPDGPCVEALEATGAVDTIPMYADRHSARAALQH